LAGYQNRATTQELENQVTRMSREQGNEVAEKFASSLYNILYQNNHNNQYFLYLIKNIENIKQNNELISNYQLVLNSSNLDAVTILKYETSISQLQLANQTIINQITSNHEMLQRLNDSIAIDNSVILRELANLRRGGGGGETSNQFIDNIDRL
jgi:hypothetical protein